MKKQSKTALAKIDFTVYKQVQELVKSRSSEFPSVKNFIESAIKKQLEVGGYLNSQRSQFLPAENARKAEKNFLPCLVCGKVFLCVRDELERGRNICPNCKRAIAYFAEKIRK